MRTIYLVRHAKSSWKNAELDDIDRPLNGRGVRNAYEMAGRLEQQNIVPDILVTSPAIRAAHTAIIFARVLGYPGTKIRFNEDLYGVASHQFLEIIQEIKDSRKTAMLFSHNPGVTNLANDLVGNEAEIENVPTSGIVCVEYNVNSWSKIKPYTGKLYFFDYPKKMTS